MSRTVGDLDERTLVARITARVGRNPDGVIVGPGDDAAVLPVDAGRLVVTVDRAREGVHFRSDWMSAQQAGWRAVTTAASDIFAMGAEPLGAVCAVELPREMPVAHLDDLATGIAMGAQNAGATVVGGDVGIGESLAIVTTVYGTMPTGVEPLTRSGARTGDEVWVVGEIGLAAAGRLLLSRGAAPADGEWAATAIDAYVAPVTSQAWCATAAKPESVHAMMDISDGLALDLHRMCEASQLGCELAAETLDSMVRPELAAAVSSRSRDLVLSGGDDYAMLCALAPDAATDLAFGAPARCLGRFVADSGVWLRDANGLIAVGATGWDPFRES
ncbi:MAG: thiamine-phosphate kinase [Acidobacteria bacterium]|nr:thiamine-phosphate kinase [Acidobacteriota bacterium]